MQFLRKLFDNNEREVQRYRKVVEKINALEPAMKKLSDDELRAKTLEFKERVQVSMDEACKRYDREWDDLDREEKRLVTDAGLDPLVVEAFAVAREAAVRTLGMRPFDVQLVGGMVLHDGRIAEMRTGEGKTLTATMPIYLNALTGRGVHLVTVNDYLSKVGAVTMGRLYHFLGLSVGIIQGQSAETGDIGGSYIFDPDFRHPDPRYDFARPAERRRDAYLCDITYGTNNEFGFDYLRDNLAVPGQELNQPELVFAIVDEVDSILIDEARTPLIISGQAKSTNELYVKMDRVIRQLREERDFTIEEKERTAVFTDDGQRRVELALGINNLTDSENISLMQHATAALKAHTVYRKDIDYLVRENEEGKKEIVIIDEFTGRLMFGRRWSDGLHQAVEAKEGVKIENESQTLATITFQNLFRLYPKLAGMTGTAKTEEDEFRKIYALDVVTVPTNRPMIRIDNPDMIYKTEEAKMRGIAREILGLYTRQQPVLVGTRSVESSERVSDRLRFDRLEMLALTDLMRMKLENAKLNKTQYLQYSDLINQKLTTLTAGKLADVARALDMPPSMSDPRNVDAVASLLEVKRDNRTYLDEALSHGIPHNILNAKYHEKEARIIADAGRKGAVTIATNMAGRGVDILLGGTIVSDLQQEGEEDAHEYRRGGHPTVGLTPVGALGSAEHQKEADDVRSVGGLFVLGTERHESRRIDNQLRGRSGRQGDPGASRFFVSMEDELMRIFGDKSNSPLLASWAEDQAIDAPLLSRMIENAQKKVEMHYFDMRKHTLDYDDVMNIQRGQIYAERRRIMMGADLRATIAHYLEDAVLADINNHAPESLSVDEWNLDGLYQSLNQLFPLANYVSLEDIKGKRRNEMEEMLVDAAQRSYADKEELFRQVIGEEEGVGELRSFERRIMLQSLDRYWMQHLANMDYLREGIGWRGMSGTDPLVLYRKEARDMFEEMTNSAQEEVVRVVSFLQIQSEPNTPEAPRESGARPLTAVTPRAAAPEEEIVGSRAERRRAMKAKSKGRRF
ncbi:MAG: preprotein translocase subunit SecA [Capsulimonadaceae bacterium]